MKSIIEKLKTHYTTYQQAVLLLSRYSLNDEIVEYVNCLFKDYEFDWDKFIGVSINHRVASVIYNNLCKCLFDAKKMLPAFYYMFCFSKKRNTLYFNEIKKISDCFESNKLKYAFVKGSVINNDIYEHGERISNDIDLIISCDEINKVTKLLNGLGYVQAKYKNNKVVAATRKEILLAKLNTYELFPFIKCLNDDYLEISTIDINIKIFNECSKNIIDSFLDNTCVSNDIRTLSNEFFLLFLCLHLYREAYMLYKILNSSDLLLYKFMDIHFFVKKKIIDWDKLTYYAKKMHIDKAVYYALYHTELLYPHTTDSSVLSKIMPSEIDYLNQYYGDEEQIFTWEMPFYDRIFNYRRKCEVISNLTDESNKINIFLSNLNKD